MKENVVEVGRFGSCLTRICSRTSYSGSLSAQADATYLIVTDMNERKEYCYSRLRARVGYKVIRKLQKYEQRDNIVPAKTPARN